jgi:hypothetical protein
VKKTHLTVNTARKNNKNSIFHRFLSKIFTKFNKKKSQAFSDSLGQNFQKQVQDNLKPGFVNTLQHELKNSIKNLGGDSFSVSLPNWLF